MVGLDMLVWTPPLPLPQYSEHTFLERTDKCLVPPVGNARYTTALFPGSHHYHYQCRDVLILSATFDSP